MRDPGLLRLDQRGPRGTYVLFFDGHTGWEILPDLRSPDPYKTTGTPVALAGGELAFAQGYLSGFELNLWLADRMPGYSVTSPRPNVLRIEHDGQANDFTLDPVTGLPLKSAGVSLSDPNRPVPAEMHYEGWKEVAGVRFPTHRVNYLAGVNRGEVTTSDIRVNVGLRPQDLAAKPAGTAPDIASRLTRQDSSLDNLIHAPGYETAPLETVGRIIRRGSGPTDVLLIPGWGFGAEVFEPFMETAEAAASDYRMVAVTLPGFGGTPAPPMPPAGTSYGDATWIGGAVEAVAHVIRSEQLRTPIVVGHFLVGTQVAVRLAVQHPELVGGLLIIGGEPMRGIAPGRPRMSRESRVAFVDTALAPKWFKTVTKATFDANNYKAEWYSKDSARAALLWRQSADVPLPVMIRYLCEYTAMDTWDDYARLTIPTHILVPGFTPAFRTDSTRRSAMNLFVDAWGLVKATNAAIVIDTVSDSRTFVATDQPRAVAQALRQLSRHVKED